MGVVFGTLEHPKSQTPPNPTVQNWGVSMLGSIVEFSSKVWCTEIHGPTYNFSNGDNLYKPADENPETKRTGVARQSNKGNFADIKIFCVPCL